MENDNCSLNVALLKGEEELNKKQVSKENNAWEENIGGFTVQPATYCSGLYCCQGLESHLHFIV